MDFDYGDQSQIPPDHSQIPSGVAGAAGREAAVQAQLQTAYDLGHDAPQSDFSGEVYRGVSSRFADSFLDSTYSAKSGGRYNAPGDPLLYTSPSASEASGEAGAYNGMANRTITRSQFDATVDPATGQGGVANVTDALVAKGVDPGAFTAPKGAGDGPWYYRALGESPYSMPQQVGRGAANAGASAMEVRQRRAVRSSISSRRILIRRRLARSIALHTMRPVPLARQQRRRLRIR